MGELRTITIIFCDKSGNKIPYLDVKSRYEGSTRENSKKTDVDGIFIFQATPNRMIEILAKPPNQDNYITLGLINSSTNSPLQINLPKTLDEYKNNQGNKNKGIVRTVFKIVDSGGRLMANFPIQSRPKDKSNSKDLYTDPRQYRGQQIPLNS